MLEFVFNSFVTLLVVVDPLGLAPIFAALTRGYPEKRKREVAVRGTIIGAAILLLFAIAGDVLLEALGISIPAFRMAGGVLLFLLSLDMIFASPSGLRSRTVREQEEISYEDDVSVFPPRRPAARRAGRYHDRAALHRRAEGHGAGGVRRRAPRGPALSLVSLLLAPASCGSAARPGAASSPACPACSSPRWPPSSSSTA